MISLYFYWLIYLKRKLEAASFTHFTAHHSRHLFHEFLTLLKLFDQTIDFCDVTPAPLAMRFLRDTLRIPGLVRSAGVMEG